MADDVVFDEEQQLSPLATPRSALGGIAQWLVTKQIAKNEKEATAYLVATAVIAVIVAIATPYVIGGQGGSIQQEDVNALRKSTGGTPYTP